jgi:hypothetical protein
MEPPRFLAVFNFPGGKVTQGRRDVTNVPAQALALLNDPFVVQQADLLAVRLASRPGGSARSRVEELFRTALGRPPTAEEGSRMEAAVWQLAGLHGVSKGEIAVSRAVWRDVAHAVFNLQEFIFIP